MPARGTGVAACSGVREREIVVVTGASAGVGRAVVRRFAQTRAVPLQAASCAANYANRGFTDNLRVDLLHDEIDIHVTMVQLPAVNTPQFDWSRTHMPRQVQPIPPIFQPEIIADTIFWAARARRREVYLGWPSIKAIVGNKLAPGLADRVLAGTGLAINRPTSRSRPISVGHGEERST